MTEWRPIETAPRDGTEIIILVNYPQELLPEKVKYEAGEWKNYYEHFRDNQIFAWAPIPENTKKHFCQIGNQVCESTLDGKLHFWEDGYHHAYPTAGPRTLAYVKFCPFCGGKA